MKYSAKRCTFDGHNFDSQLERDCYLILKQQHDRGLISTLYLQHRFPLSSASNEPIGNYVADFLAILPNGQKIVIEAKGQETALWRWKEKHFRADYPDTELLVINRASVSSLYQVGVVAA